MSRYEVKVRYTVGAKLGCGCWLPKYERMTARRSQHQARARFLPVICPTCGADTHVDRLRVRDA